MSRLRVWVWVGLVLGGLGLMYWSFGQSEGQPTPWDGALLYVDDAPKAGEKVERPGIPVTILFLPPSPDTEMLANALKAQGSTNVRGFLQAREEKVLLMPELGKVVSEDLLASGRLPKPGAKEVLAGQDVSQKDQVAIDGQDFQVVGILRRAPWPFARVYLMPEDPAVRGLFDASKDSVRPGYLVTVDERRQTEKLSEVFPKERFMPMVGMARVERGLYYAYWLGMVLFVTGGSGLLISLFQWAASKVQNAWLGPPLAEMSRRRGLLVAIHLVYFGITLAGMLVVYELPAVQQMLLTQVHSQLEEPSNPLGVAGTAYASRNIAYAAATTLAINFFLGSFLMITVPSILIPGIGTLLSLFRALAWGLLLAPTFLELAGGMRLHTGTLLLEGEGYILATFFALLVPIYLFSPQEGATVASRYGRALLMNLKGNLLVFLVLTVAAIYEAIEVIAQMVR